MILIHYNSFALQFIIPHIKPFPDNDLWQKHGEAGTDNVHELKPSYTCQQ